MLKASTTAEIRIEARVALTEVRVTLATVRSSIMKLGIVIG